MTKKKNRISYLIFKSILEELNPSEQDELTQWKLDPGNLNFYNEILKKHNFNNISKQFEYLKSQKSIVKRKIIRRLIIRNIYSYSKYAAILVILISSIIYLNHIDFHFNNIFRNKKTIAKSIELNAPILKLSNGNNLILSKQTRFSIDSNISINITKRQIKYSNIHKSGKDSFIKTDTLITPKQCDYQVILEDGSIAHLNSSSKLIFPKSFMSQNERIVEIEGEVYFEVVKDNRPFIVKTQSQSLKVLGTKFNINTYTNNTITTLVEGSVSVSKENDDRIIVLKPGEQSILNESGISVQEVDISDEIAWVRGEFIFRQKRLEDILNTLEFWYDFEVKYESEKVKDYVFFVKVKKMDNPETLFNLLEQASDIKFELKEKQLRVR